MGFWAKNFRWGRPNGQTPNNHVFQVVGDSLSNGYPRWTMRWHNYLTILSNGALVHDEFTNTTTQPGYQLFHCWDSGQTDRLAPVLGTCMADILLLALGANGTGASTDFAKMKAHARAIARLMLATGKIVVILGLTRRVVSLGGAADVYTQAGNEVLREVAHELGVPFADLYAATAEGDAADYCMPGDSIHWNGKGAYAVAQEVLKAIKRAMIVNAGPLIAPESDYASATNTRGKLLGPNTTASWGYGGGGSTRTGSLYSDPTKAYSQITKGILGSTGSYWVQDVGLSNWSAGDVLLWTVKMRSYGVTGGGDGTDLIKIPSWYLNWKTNLLNYTHFELNPISYPGSVDGDTGFVQMATIFKVPASGITNVNVQMYSNLFGPTNPADTNFAQTVEFADMWVWNLTTRGLAI